MSKIQKALHALRKGNAGEVNTTKTSPGFLPGSGMRHVAKARHVAGDHSYLPHVEKGQEPIPRNHVDIDLERLVEQGLAADGEQGEELAQQFRRIKRPIMQCAFETDLLVGENANVIMMASALPGSGKSFSAINLARSISIERDVGAVLVDADVLKPRISTALGLESNIGLIDYLIDPELELEDILVSTNLNDIVILPAGGRHAESTELLASRRMRELIRQLSNQFVSRAVIFDTPPLLITSEAQVLAANMGQVALVIEAGVTSQEAVMRALMLLDREKPINAILNKTRGRLGRGGYGRGDYGYYAYSVYGGADDAS